MLEYVPEGVKTCLEFGCGTGGFSWIMKDRVSTENWAVELDTASAEKAAQKLDKVILRKIGFGKLDIEVVKLPKDISAYPHR